MKTIMVVTAVSFRVGQVTFEISCRTSRMYFAGVVVAIFIQIPGQNPSK